MQTRIVYAAKYWDTLGIEEVEVEKVADPQGFYTPVNYAGWKGARLSFSDTFATLQEARYYVAGRRLAKLKALDRKLKRLEAIDPEKLIPKPRTRES